MLNNGCVPSESGPTEVTADFRFTRVMAEQAARARLTLDDDQLSLIARLDALGQQLVSTTGRPQGVYVWGRTGRGKSFILDHFFASLPLAARRRVHFHHFFRELHPWLPFTYGINAMRGPIAGLYANHYWLDMLHLFWYLPAALFVGLVIRRYAMNLNALFDRRLGDTDLMITEHNSMVNEQVSLNSVFRTVSDSKELRDIIAHRAHRFFARYPKMIVAGLALLTVLPFVFLVLLFVTQEKIAMLTSWILSIILIDAYLIVVEYAREAYAMQLGVSAMSADEFRNVMLNGYVWRRFHGHGRHEAAMGSNPDIGETTERLTPFSDQATEPTAHTAQSGQSGQSGQGGAR